MLTWTYNPYGQALTFNGARNDRSDTTSYAYYDAVDPDLGKRGNLKTITNPLGHVTQITAYDGNGRPLSIIDPNGIRTDLSYTPRGWLKTRTVTAADSSSALITQYDYDNVGQLTKVTAPDAQLPQLQLRRCTPAHRHHRQPRQHHPLHARPDG